MPRVTLVDLELEYLKIRESYISNLAYYLGRIKEMCRKFDPNCRLIVFGSYVRGGMRVDSDIDILLITDQACSASYRGRVRLAIAREIGLITPLEIHIITTKEYEEWYRKFIDVYLEV
ncbi:MAG: nucleotidyltransferase domain-containing protein [Candidatus Bathyarchaeia archaeon]|nr:nucleotidyltransferase domain-containing protein [Candidatus Bathyarchaeota archaeon]